MKNWKTTLAGIAAGLPLAIDALTDAYSAGFFTGKTGLELWAGIALIVMGAYAQDLNKKQE